MEAHFYAQVHPFSVDNSHFQKAPLPSSFTRFAHKNFFSTEFIHIHVDFCSSRLYFLVGRWITWIYSSFRPNFSPRAWIPPTYSSFRIQSPSQPPVTNNYRPQIQNTPHDCSQEPPYGVFDIAVYSVYSAEVCPSVRVTVVDCSVPSR